MITKLSCVLLLVLLASCTHTEFTAPRAQLDLSPVGCDYRWFQTGYSPDIQMSCEDERSALSLTQFALAARNAWDIAEQRCPAQCPPRELQDTVAWENPSPDGVCRDGVVYFHTRLFFTCGHGR